MNFDIKTGKGPFKCYVTLFSWKFDPHPPPGKANNVEPYIFVMLFSGKADTHPLLRYVTLEWPRIKQNYPGGRMVAKQDIIE